MGTTNRTSAMLAATLFAAAISGCSNNPSSGSAAYKAGELGNGDFLFACAGKNQDGAACLPYTNATTKFPTRIASGSTFDITFVAKSDQGTKLITDNPRYEGVVVDGVEPYVRRTVDGTFSATQPGYAVVYARDSAGSVIDFTSPIHIVKVDNLAIYDAEKYVADNNDENKVPVPVDSIELTVGTPRSFRVRAEDANGEPLAGSIAVSWKSGTDADKLSAHSLAWVGVLQGFAPVETDVTIEGAAIKKTVHVTVKAAEVTQ